MFQKVFVAFAMKCDLCCGAVERTMGLDFADNQGCVMAAEAERVAQSDIDLCLACLQRDIVHFKVAAFVLVVEVGGGEDDRFINGFDADYKLNRAAGTD